MKRTFYMAAVLTAALASCKNDAKPADATAPDTTGKKVENTNTAAVAEEELSDAELTPKAGEVLLRLAYPKGYKQQLNYVVDTKGQAMNGTIGVTLDYVVSSVSSAERPVFGFTGEVKALMLDYDAQGQVVKYDSRKKLPADASAMVKSMDEKFKTIFEEPLTFELNNRGRLVKEMTFTNNSAQKEMPFDISSYQIEFPVKPVGVGSTWSSESADKQVGGMKINTYTVKEITDTEVVIDVKTVMPAPPMKGAKPSVFTGTYTVNKKTGMLAKGNLSGNVETMGAVITMTFTGKEIK